MEKYIIDDRIFKVKFSCDLNKCKGACCTLKGAGGAPILDSEVELIRENLEVVRKYLEPRNLKYLDNEGFLEGEKGDYAVNSVDEEDCVFSFYEKGIVNCAFQKAYNNGETDFRKPISCHLFPVRIRGDKRNIIKYEQINECEDALVKGVEDNITIFEFAKESLVREYGNEFYNELKEKYLK